MGDGALSDAVGSVLDVERPAPKSDSCFGDAVAVGDDDGVVIGLRGPLLRRGVGCLGDSATIVSQPRALICADKMGILDGERRRSGIWLEIGATGLRVTLSR